YASKWWDSFTNLVILGPVMAFFLWLSLAVVAQVNSGIEDVGMAETAGLAGLGIAEDANEGFDDLNVAGTEIGTFQGVIGYMLGIGMLLATMAAASELGAGGGKFAGQATGAITGWAAGKNGPSPMRFARERFDAYKGNRDSIRKDKAKRTGDALSSFQDRQVGKLPLVGERARARANVHDEKVLADAIDTTSKADKMDGMTVDDLRVLHKTGSKTQQIRAEQLLATKGRLTAADEDDIRRVSNYLTGTEIGRKLDDDIKAKNFEAAFAAKYMRGTGAARNVDTAMLTNDAVDGKVNLSSLTKEHAKSIKRADADYLTTLADNARDAQQLEKMAGSMNEEVKEMFASTITKTKADGISLSFDKRLALTKAKVAGFDIFDSDKVIEYAGKNQKNRDEVLQSLPSSFRAPAGQALVEKLYADIRIAPKEDDMKKMSAAGKTAWNNTTLEIITAANIAGDMSPAANRARDNAIKNQNKLTHDVAGVETNIYHDLNSPELSEFIKKSKAEDLKKLSLTQFGLPGSADQTAVLKQLADNLGTTKLGELAKEIADKDVIREVINYMRGPGGASVAELDSIRKNNNLSKYF
ncbi:MAG: hypothetical protein Q8Q49_05870, partial [bacterium]|nr:hypothetical protein [bacterium]